MWCAIFLHGALSVWCWETVTVFCWCFWLNRFELDILHGKDKKDIRAPKSQTQTHTGQQKWAFIHSQGCVALLISLSFKKVCERGCAGMIYSQLLIHIHQRVRAPQPTSHTHIHTCTSPLHTPTPSYNMCFIDHELLLGLLLLLDVAELFNRSSLKNSTGDLHFADCPECNIQARLWAMKCKYYFFFIISILVCSVSTSFIYQFIYVFCE